jgi:hypothetical protein
VPRQPVPLPTVMAHRADPSRIAVPRQPVPLPTVMVPRADRLAIATDLRADPSRIAVPRQPVPLPTVTGRRAEHSANAMRRRPALSLSAAMRPANPARSDLAHALTMMAGHPDQDARHAPTHRAGCRRAVHAALQGPRLAAAARRLVGAAKVEPCANQKENGKAEPQRPAPLCADRCARLSGRSAGSTQPVQIRRFESEITNVEDLVFARTTWRLNHRQISRRLPNERARNGT